MIYGVGTDVIDVARIAAALERWGERFAARILSEPELRRFRDLGKPAAYLAKRFAAKEAFAKALGTGIRAPANWHDIRVDNLASGRPVLQYSVPLKGLLETQRITNAHLSLSDERNVAFATVIIECEN